jgi:methylenetetrahydrofolate/methylenetetrahydromethanopterin dehydrogenase (NADP+)
MSDKKRILIQIDPDAQASVFDRVVAIDSSADELFSYGNVTLEQITGLVHGAIFTRGPSDLKHTAIFIGGSDVTKGEAYLKAVLGTFFGPMRVSVMMDANGANTTAAAAVVAARKHMDLTGSTALVLAGTGPVGQRVCRLLAREGATVRLGSRSLEKATEAAKNINQVVGTNLITGVSTGDPASLLTALNGVNVVVSAGAAGVPLLPEATRVQMQAQMKVMIDLNAVPPGGIELVGLMDRGENREGIICYGAIGVGATKMKIHRSIIRSLFMNNSQVFDAEEIYNAGKTVGT